MFRDINDALESNDTKENALESSEKDACILCMEETGVFNYFHNIVRHASMQEANKSLMLYACIFELVQKRLEWMVAKGVDACVAAADADSMAMRWHDMREYMDDGEHATRINAVTASWQQTKLMHVPEHLDMIIVNDDDGNDDMEIFTPNEHAATSELSSVSNEQRINILYKNELRSQRLCMTPEFEQHAYQKMSTQVSANTLRRLHREWRDFDNCLALDGLYGNIYVSWSFPNQPSLWRIVITPALGTPYAGGCFFFDMRVLPSYPSSPPIMQFLTTGQGTVRFNPNLYCSGKVCLSLLGTWIGESWNARVSNLNQLLMSILAMIFVDDPFFNEPGYQSLRGTDEGAKRSTEYNANVRYHTLEYAVYKQLQSTQDPRLSPLVRTHFDILWNTLQPEYVRWANEERDPQRREKMHEWIDKSDSIIKIHRMV